MRQDVSLPSGFKISIRRGRSRRLVKCMIGVPAGCWAYGVKGSEIAKIANIDSMAPLEGGEMKNGLWWLSLEFENRIGCVDKCFLIDAAYIVCQIINNSMT